MYQLKTVYVALLGLLLHSMLAITAAISHSATSTHNVWEFPNGTWVENIAVRTNGQLLVTFISSPVVYQVDPFGAKKPALVHQFPDALAALGIAEVQHDVFAVISGNWSDKTFSGTTGSFSVWKVDVRSFESRADGSIISPATVTKISDIPDGVFLNGLTLLDKKTGAILISDAGAGVVLKVNTISGEHDVIIDDPLMKPKSGAFPVLGINGIHIHDSFLYFTNTFENTFNKVQIHSDGTAVGPTVTIAHDGLGDDFAIDAAGNAYVTQGGGNTVVEITAEGAEFVIAGNLNSTVVAGSTAAQFGRTVFDRNVLYVTTNGGIVAPVDEYIIDGGKVVAIDLGV
ncbi:hypothetical protein MMC17_000038 [Xylographa soralifera]|nr:hypothetical protein [Xylographa soralifera]